VAAVSAALVDKEVADKRVAEEATVMRAMEEATVMRAAEKAWVRLVLSSTAWVRLVLSHAPLHLVSSMAPCCCVVVHCSGA
jgi:hypothetical protein